MGDRRSFSLTKDSSGIGFLRGNLSKNEKSKTLSLLPSFKNISPKSKIIDKTGKLYEVDVYAELSGSVLSKDLSVEFILADENLNPIDDSDAQLYGNHSTTTQEHGISNVKEGTYKIYPRINSQIFMKHYQKKDLDCTDIAKDYEVGDNLRNLLTKIYSDCEGKNWEHQKNWLSDKPVSEWEGIGEYTINKDNRIERYTRFDFIKHNKLKGDLIIKNFHDSIYIPIYGKNQLESIHIEDCPNTIINGYYEPGLDTDTISRYNVKTLKNLYLGNIAKQDSIGSTDKCIPSLYFDSYHNLETVTLDKCNLSIDIFDTPSLKELTISNTEGDYRISVKNCSGLENVYLQDIGNTLIGGPSGLLGYRNAISINNCKGIDSLYINDSNPSLGLVDCDINNIKIDGSIHDFEAYKLNEILQSNHQFYDNLCINNCNIKELNINSPNGIPNSFSVYHTEIDKALINYQSVDVQNWDIPLHSTVFEECSIFNLDVINMSNDYWAIENESPYGIYNSRITNILTKNVSLNIGGSHIKKIESPLSGEDSGYILSHIQISESEIEEIIGGDLDIWDCTCENLINVENLKLSTSQPNSYDYLPLSAYIKGLKTFIVKRCSQWYAPDDVISFSGCLDLETIIFGRRIEYEDGYVSIEYSGGGADNGLDVRNTPKLNFLGGHARKAFLFDEHLNYVKGVIYTDIINPICEQIPDFIDNNCDFSFQERYTYHRDYETGENYSIDHGIGWWNKGEPIYPVRQTNNNIHYW